MKAIRFAIVGCGRIAERHAKQITQLGELSAACDIIGDRADRLTSRFGGTAFGSLSSMLASGVPIEVLAVCTPNGLHRDHTLAALDAGVHVLCEKPMALHVEDCSAMINAAQNARRHLFIVKQNRFNPPVAAVKNLLDKNVLGRVISAHVNCFWNRGPQYYSSDDWKGTLALDGGTLFTQFSHFIDLLYWTVGDVDAACGFAGNFAHQGITEFEDTGVASLKFKSGAIGSISFTTNAHDKNMEGSLTLFCEKGTVKIGGQYLNELEYQSIADYAIKELEVGNPANNYGQYQGSMSNHDHVYKNVVDVLRNGSSIAATGYEGLKTVEIITKIYNAVGRGM